MTRFIFSSILILSISHLSAQIDWSYNPADYEFTHNITGQVYVNGEIAEGESLQLGAFHGDECRGTAFATQDAKENHTMFYLTMHGSETNTEDIHFVLENGSGEETELVNTVRFMADGITCSPDAPFLWKDEVLYAPTDFLSFAIAESDEEAEINPNAHEILMEVKAEIEISALTPVFELAPGATALVNNEKQTSGENILDFASKVIYSVQGVDGSVTEWSVHITKSDVSINTCKGQNLTVYPTITNHNAINIIVREPADYEIHTLDGKPVKNGRLQKGENRIYINQKGMMIYRILDIGGSVRSGKLVFY
ncbi:MAG: hypothetical protein ACOCTO_00150 [Marinilabiliaceae bacterium]